jgi:hypothetical protein
MDEMTTSQMIRADGLRFALHLEQSMPAALTYRTDDLSPGDEITEQDITVMNERAGLAEQAIADRVLRHARLFAEYISTGFDSGELDGLTTLDGDRPAEGDRHGGG